MRECCENCELAPDDGDKTTKIEHKPVRESDTETRTFARAVYILLLLDLNQEGEAFRVTSFQRQKLYLETIASNAAASLASAVSAASSLPPATILGRGRSRRDAAAAAVATATAAVAAAKLASDSIAAAEPDVTKMATDIIGFNAFAKSPLTPKEWLEKIFLNLYNIRRFEDAAIRALLPHLNAQEAHVMKQASCALGALARKGSDKIGLAKLEATIAEHRKSTPVAPDTTLCLFCDLMAADPVYSAACNGTRCHSNVEALGLDHVASTDALEFARGIFVYVVADINANFHPERVVRGGFGTANFAAQRVALGSLLGYLSPQEMLSAEQHIEKWERAAGKLIKEVVVDTMYGEVQLRTPRDWFGAIKGLLSKFNECEVGLLSLINEGLSSARKCNPVQGKCELPCKTQDRRNGKTRCAYDRHSQADARADNSHGIWSRAGCGLTGLVKFV
jgi:hypothetical protein